MKRIVISIVVVVVVVGIVVLGILRYRSISSERTVTPSSNSGKVSVVTTLFPLYDFARVVGGDRAEVSLILPPGVEPHGFEPTPGDILEIDASDIFVYTGPMMEPWAVDVATEASHRGVAIVDASAGLTLLDREEEDHDTEHEEDHGDADHEIVDSEEANGHHHEGGVDPHVWLDFDNASRMIAVIADTLIARDPANADFYRTNANLYQTKLLALDAEYRARLADCDSRTIVSGGHFAFGYLAHRYGLGFEAAQGFSPDAEPSARDLAMLADQVRREGIRTIFAEELSNPKVADTIAAETGASVLSLDAAHNLTREQFVAGTTFIDLMEENLKVLEEGLGCRKK